MTRAPKVLKAILTLLDSTVTIWPFCRSAKDGCFRGAPTGTTAFVAVEGAAVGRAAAEALTPVDVEAATGVVVACCCWFVRFVGARKSCV